jgi:hypothetical protein
MDAGRGRGGVRGGGVGEGMDVLLEFFGLFNILSEIAVIMSLFSSHALVRASSPCDIDLRRRKRWGSRRSSCRKQWRFRGARSQQQRSRHR